MSEAASQGFTVPPFPLPMRVALGAWKAAARLGVGIPDFDEARMIAEARRNTGLHHFGDDGFRVPMRQQSQPLPAGTMC